MKKLIIHIIWITFLLNVFSMKSVAQENDTIDIFNLSFEELLNLKVEVISKRAIPLRETPGVITVISSDDIKRSGAKDLLEVLMLLAPGFEFGVDVEGVVGIGMRGLWAHEGKLLLLVDGLECNEDVFSNTLFGNHYLVENIEKIEIVRGPGSAIYGGYASLAVINIITKSSAMKGGYAGVLYSQMSETFSHRNVNFGFGNKKHDFGISLTGVYSQGNRSQRDNIDYYNQSMPMKNNSEIETINLNLNMNYKGFDFRLFTDFYTFDQIDLWGANRTQGTLTEKFNTIQGRLQYELKIGNKLKIVPLFQYKYQLPWNVDVPEENYACTKNVNKYIFNTTSIWDITSKMNLVSGIEYYQTNLALSDNHPAYEETFKNGSHHTSYSNMSAFSQYMYIADFANLTLGLRFDNSTEYGNSFVPRIGITKAYEKFHFKAMFSQSFRIPGGIIPSRVPDNVPSIVPEKATNYEIELGVKIGETSYLTANAFHVTFDKVIIYGRESTTGVGTYLNSGKMGTLGFDVDYKFKSKIINMNLNYSFYKTLNNEITNFVVPGNEDLYLGFAKNKLNALLSFKISETYSISTSCSMIGKRYSFVSFDEFTQDDVLKEFDPLYLAGINILAEDFIIKGFDASLGVSNLLDQKHDFLQPYRGSHAPLPSLSRAFQIRIAYRF